MAVNIDEILPSPTAKPKTVLWDGEKFNHKFIVRPAPGGFILYEVAVTKGNIPNELSGYYTSMKHGVQAVKKYIEDSKPSKTVQRDKRSANRAKQKEQEEARV